MCPADGSAPVAPIQDQEVKDVIAALFSLGGAIAAVVKDGKISLSDLPTLSAVFPKLSAAAGEITAARAELTKMSQAEIDDLAIYLAAQVGGVVASADIVAKVDAGIQWLESTYAFAKLFIK